MDEKIKTFTEKLIEDETLNESQIYRFVSVID